MRVKLSIIVFLCFSIGFSSTKVSVIQSNGESLAINVNFRPNSINDLKPFHILVGLPNERLPNLNVQMSDLTNSNFSVITDQETSIEWIHIQKLRGLWVGTIKIIPGITDNQFHSSLTISMNHRIDKLSMSNASEDKLLETKIINWDIAKNWIRKNSRQLLKQTEIPVGQWFKFAVIEDGIYKLDVASLANLYPSISTSNTKSWMLYTGGNLGRSQIQTPGYPAPNTNLVEIAFHYNSSVDGSFSKNDELVFYGRGASGFDNNGVSVNYNQNLYFNENVYWLLIPNDNTVTGNRIDIEHSSSSPMITLDYGVRYIHYEVELINPFESGLGWAEQSISTNNFVQKTISIDSPVDDIDAVLNVGFLGGTSDVNARPTPLNSIASGINALQSDNLGSTTWSGLGQKNSSFTIPFNLLNNGDNTFFFTNISGDSYSQTYFDYLTLSYGQDLNYIGEQFEFYTPIHSNTVQYTIESNDPFKIWNVTNYVAPLELNLTQTNTEYSFIISTPQDTLDRLIVFDPNNIPSISNIEYIGSKDFSTLANSNIQSDHIIITDDDFSNAANKLITHRANSILADLELIYDEFSGGNPDPMAIRNFISWTQKYWQAPQPTEIFLIGDADYDYRNITGNSNVIVPTVEVGITNSYATDDRLGTVNGYIPEVAFGRFPAQNVQQAEDYINKLIEFETNPDYGLWRQRVTLVADDGARPEDSASELYIGKSHTINSEILADIIPPEIETYKLYMLEYPEESNSSSFGVAKPEATSALFDILTKGTAIINYIGHGSAHQWAQERLLYQDRGDLQLISTGMKLPIWIAGTCSWGHFDNIGSESFSEELIRQSMNGASAIITTSRAITVTSNQYYEEQLFYQLFPENTISDNSIGIILQSIKTGNQEGEYFHLFGDPAMKLPLPTGKLDITSVKPDTLLTLGESNFFAKQKLSTSGGIGYTVIAEEEREVTREYNFLSNVESLTYNLPGSTLFRGQFSFNNQDISGQFRIPKDIDPSSESTSLKLYISTNDEVPVEGLGLIDSLMVLHGGVTNDDAGPIITFETQSGRILRSGDHIIEDDEIVVRITDPLGINLTGETGHDIVLTDNITESEAIITDEFIYDNNSITTGTAVINSEDMSSDIHIVVKAWDSANNPSENEIKLYRISMAKLKLFNVLNFPNPFSGSTQFTFEIPQPAEVGIIIYTLGGRKIMEIDSKYFDIGYHTIFWNGKDAFGDRLANGVYLFKIKAKGNNENASFIGRIAKYE